MNVVTRKSLYVPDDVYPIDKLTLFTTVRKIDFTGHENLLEVFDRQRVQVGWDAHGNLRKRVLLENTAHMRRQVSRGVRSLRTPRIRAREAETLTLQTHLVHTLPASLPVRAIQTHSMRALYLILTQ